MISKLKNINPYFKPILESLSALADRMDVRVYLVGGVVRDLMLGEKIFDLDIVVEADAIEFAHKFADIHKKEFKKHHAFGTAVVYFDNHHIDFVTARSEIYSTFGALPKVKPASLKDDLLRRDFTINAMAISLNKPDYGKLVDYYFGEKDLKNGLIRVLHDNSFMEDPTRILRAIRFEQRFSFKLQVHTLKLAKEAIRKNALSFVNPHRRREELVLILKEPSPARYIKRLYELKILPLIGIRIILDKNDFRAFTEIERVLGFYKTKFKRHRQLEEWLIYLMAILRKAKRQEAAKLLDAFGFRKGEKIRILSLYDNMGKVRQLNKKVLPHVIYKTLNPLSFENIIFFYAYYRKKKIRKHIEIFLDKLINIRLKLKGEDLKRLGFKPPTLYGKLFERLLYAKIDKGFKTLEEEICEVRIIFESCQSKH
jgi:tRNA nucleotidyltransferase (CCA-adding enzyme)